VNSVEDLFSHHQRNNKSNEGKGQRNGTKVEDNLEMILQ
jgi:hypothetical protein